MGCNVKLNITKTESIKSLPLGQVRSSRKRFPLHGHSARNLGKPSIHILIHSLLNCTSIRIRKRLRLQHIASSAKAAGLHSLLQAVTLPPEDVYTLISMLTIQAPVEYLQSPC